MTPCFLARGRVVSPRRIHRDQSHEALEERCEVLQRSRHRRAVDQRREERGEVDKALLPHVQGQPDSPTTVRTGLQPGELLAENGVAPGDRALVADHAAGETGEDWGKGRAAREVRDVPTGRDGRTSAAVRCNPRPDRTHGDPAARCRCAMLLTSLADGTQDFGGGCAPLADLRPSSGP